MLELPDLSRPRHQTTPAPAVSPQVSVHLPLSDPSRIRLPQCAHSNVVPLPHPDLPERTGMVGAPDGPVGDGLRTPGQLFPVGRRLATGATPTRRATPRGVADPAGRYRPNRESDAR